MTAVSFDRDRLVADAIAATGLDDFGPPTWQEGLDRLLDSLAGEARLNELGVTVVETEIGGLSAQPARHRRPPRRPPRARRPVPSRGRS